MLTDLGLLAIAAGGGWFGYGLLHPFVVKECYLLDIAAIDSAGRSLKALVVLGIRTRPSAGNLDANDLELVAPDGTRVTEVRVYEIGREKWLVVAVPEEYVSKGGLALRQKTSGRTADLPARIEPKRTDDIR
ncbi:MAG: hypothetical protein FJ276_33505 [Planctomycetes bacterium]|nr:hypothetical protein [Planctomycetota bacterium]